MAYFHRNSSRIRTKRLLAHGESITQVDMLHTLIYYGIKGFSLCNVILVNLTYKWGFKINDSLATEVMLFNMIDT